MRSLFIARLAVAVPSMAAVAKSAAPLPDPSLDDLVVIGVTPGPGLNVDIDIDIDIDIDKVPGNVQTLQC